MPEIEARLPCPVCLGITMDKRQIGDTPDRRQGHLFIDHCGRCDGVWLEAGEVERLRALGATALSSAISAGEGGTVFRMQCHSCQGFIDRETERCPACGWKNILNCPSCDRPMQRGTHSGVTLDACANCKGAWFDRHELQSIWRMELGASLRRRQSQLSRSGVDGMGTLVLLDALSYNPWLAADAVYLAGHAAGAGVELLAHAPAASVVVVEAAGEAASGLFEAIAEIISGIFS
jgi:Zn-finger nucleic acid-binding protein